jgi:hypothetical protein
MDAPEDAMGGAIHPTHISNVAHIQNIIISRGCNKEPTRARAADEIIPTIG